MPGGDDLSRGKTELPPAGRWIGYFRAGFEKASGCTIVVAVDGAFVSAGNPAHLGVDSRNVQVRRCLKPGEVDVRSTGIADIVGSGPGAVIPDDSAACRSAGGREVENGRDRGISVHGDGAGRSSPGAGSRPTGKG